MRRVWAVLAFWIVPTLAHAEPSVRVRAESRIEIGVEYAEGNLQVRGALRDELANPIPAMPVVVTLREPSGALIEQKRVTTGPAGRFVVEREAPADRVVLQAAYAGDELYRGVRVERRIDQARADVRLELQLPGGSHIDLDREALTVRVLAESDSGGDGLPMTLQDESGRVLAEGRTDALGRLTWQVPSEALGSPGSGQLRLESSGDATRGEAQTEARVVRFRRAHLDLHLPGSPIETGSAGRASGRLFTAAGPRPEQPVGLFLNGEHVTTALTDADGAFVANLWPGQPGAQEVVARVERDPVGAYTEARAEGTLQVVAPRALPWHWLALAWLPALWLAVAKLRRRSTAPRAGERARSLPEAGVQVGSRHHRRSTERRLAGRVVHARTRHPLCDARVIAHRGDRQLWELRTDSAGCFAQPDCEPGTLVLSVEAPGHLPLTTRVTVPHRGEWNPCEIRLDSLRDQAMGSYRALVVPRLPSPLAFNLWTPREIAERVRPAFGDGFDTLTERVEHAAFAPGPPHPREIEGIDAQARALSGAPPARATARRTSSGPPDTG